VGSGDCVARFVGDVFTTLHEVARPSWGGWTMDLLMFSCCAAIFRIMIFFVFELCFDVSYRDRQFLIVKLQS
jgi:hypothetical protein